LRASQSRVRFGAAIILRGRLRPAVEGRRVAIVARGRVRARTRTDAGGRYELRLRPRRRVRLRARAGEVTSAPVTVRVRPRLRVRLLGVGLFHRARVGGTIRPGHPGARVTVRLYRNGNVVRRRRAVVRGRRFATRFRIRRPGSYRARVRFDDSDHLAAARATTRRRTRMPRLSRGASGPFVRRLERRLRALDYRITRVNRRYDVRTADAVMAFNKVQGRPRAGDVSEATWRALASPRRPRPRARSKRFHIEIDQTRQVLYTVRRGRITNILHTSTGGGGAITRDGVWRVHRKIAGYSPGRLYYPSYFDGLRAIHGWPQVPTNAASHGCARVPMWAAKWIYRKADLGTVVRIYH
jgi:hypothetical protein